LVIPYVVNTIIFGLSEQVISSNRLQAQGAFKYGGYEFFKKLFTDMVGEQNAYKYKTSLYLGASASAEFFADIALCPFEAVKVRMQTTMPPFATGTFDGIRKITANEGFGG
jgi:solute carrier family 25 (mitochondrial phosphate transporter), member 3